MLRLLCLTLFYNMCACVPLQERFTKVFDMNLWGDPKCRSGEGSNPNSKTVQDDILAMRAFLEKAHPVHSIVDAPCGVFGWLSTFLAKEDPNIEYSGYDIVPKIIAQNRLNYPDSNFEVVDLTTSSVPKADMIICRDLLNHLTVQDIHKVLNNLKESRTRWLVISNNKGAPNADKYMRDGDSRTIDITKAPFNFGRIIMEYKHLTLFQNEIV